MPTINKPNKQNKKTGKSLDIYNLVYNTKKWRKLREKYLMFHPLCERCLNNDEMNVATEVHHKKPLSTAETEVNLKYLAFNYDNLMALCANCHHLIHGKKRKSI